MDNYFTSFCLLTYVGVNNIRVTGAFNKKKVTQMYYYKGQRAAKKERNHFEQRTSSKKAVKIFYLSFIYEYTKHA